MGHGNVEKNILKPREDPLLDSDDERPESFDDDFRRKEMRRGIDLATTLSIPLIIFFFRGGGITIPSHHIGTILAFLECHLVFFLALLLLIFALLLILILLERTIRNHMIQTITYKA